jgi:fructose-1-phosphate kinase PfkB-like protein
MPPIKKITILELAPCADILLGISHDADEGYLSAEGGSIKIRSGARLRPVLLSINAGGKATNVARVIDKLLRPADAVDIELVVFRPDSPEGRYLAELQSSSLYRVRVRSVVVDSTARFCINLSDPASRAPSRVEFNLSPRALWQTSAIDVALQTARGLDTDLLVLAGNPPVVAPDCSMAADLPSSIIERVSGNPAVSIDIEKGALARCIDGHPRPDVIKINREEFTSVDGRHWGQYEGLLVVTDEDGCTVWERGPSGPAIKVNTPRGHSVYSTVGAGDATHAGFTVAHWVWGFDPVRAARYGMAAAAASVSSPEGARGVARDTVERFFAELEAGIGTLPK